MNAINISFGLLVVFSMIALVRWMRRPVPQVAGYGSQRMCPNCGLITSTSKSCCLECGKQISAVYPTSMEMNR